MRWNWYLQILFGTVVSCIGFANMQPLAETMPPLSFLAIALIGLVQIALGIAHFWKVDEVEPPQRLARAQHLKSLASRPDLPPLVRQRLNELAEEDCPPLRDERVLTELLEPPRTIIPPVRSKH